MYKIAKFIEKIDLKFYRVHQHSTTLYKSHLLPIHKRVLSLWSQPLLIRMSLSLNSGYDRYSFGIVMGRYIGLTDKENALSVSVLVSADTVFYIGSFTDTAQPYFTWCKCYICSKDFKITISKAPK